ncbi:MAG TPA: hypothetical protein VJY54_05280, partial [Lachnospiraceae bacterium]|nr:hypothetical protein [Lachnospiraceae bacterium]
MEKRKQKTKKEKHILVNNYLESGLSKTAWCRNNNIPISTFVGWEKQLNKVIKDKVIFVSPKPSKEINKEKTKSFVRRDKSSGVE